MLSSVASLAPPYFFALSHNGTIFRQKKLLNVGCLFKFSLQRSSETFIILRRIQRGIVINGKTSLCKVRIIFVRLQLKVNFLYRFSSKPHMSNFIKTPSVETELFHADGSTDTQTDMTELIVNFRNVAKMPTNLKQTKHVRGT